HKRVLAGEGKMRPALVGPSDWRAGESSFANWMATASEADRRTIAAYVLGLEAGAIDLEILRNRLWPHQVIAIATNHPLAETLAADWDGQVLSSADCMLLANPGIDFLDPAGATSPERAK